MTQLICAHSYLTIIDLSGLTSLQKLDCTDNQILNLNLSQLSTLTNLICINNSITNLDVSHNISLTNLTCSSNSLTTLDVSQNINLVSLACNSNLLTTIDLSQLHHLTSFQCIYSNIESIFLKNGSTLSYLDVSNDPNLRYICADEKNFNYIQGVLDNLSYSSCVLNSYCSFVPGGDFYRINGTITFDLDNNGCDPFDIKFPNLKFAITNGTVTSQLIVDDTGNYSITLQAGNYLITPITQNPLYFNISPSSLNINFPSTTSPFTQNFCLSPHGNYPDLDIVTLPLPISSARPGFDAEYKIVYKNMNIHPHQQVYEKIILINVLYFVLLIP